MVKMVIYHVKNARKWLRMVGLFNEKYDKVGAQHLPHT